MFSDLAYSYTRNLSLFSSLVNKSTSDSISELLGDHFRESFIRNGQYYTLVFTNTCTEAVSVKCDY
ncbi:hypothetical protein D3C79_1011770 [compost metagenome]